MYKVCMNSVLCTYYFSRTVIYALRTSHLHPSVVYEGYTKPKRATHSKAGSAQERTCSRKGAGQGLANSTLVGSLSLKPSLHLQHPQPLHVPACFHDRLHCGKTQLPSLLRGLLLPPRFSLTAPTRRHSSQDLPAVVRREVDKAHVSLTRRAAAVG